MARRRRDQSARWADRAAFALLALAPTALVLGLTVAAMPRLDAASIAALCLMLPCVLWIAGGAATAVLGFYKGRAAAIPAIASGTPPNGWTPAQTTTVLITLCGEAPEPVAARVAALSRALNRAGLAGKVDIAVLSDSAAPEAVAAEDAAFRPLVAAGAVFYRRRRDNAGRKTGNIADWITKHGADRDFIITLDADSRITAARIATLIWRMERNPRLGLLQTGIAQVGADTRFGRMQRLAVRLLSPGFGAGLAAWAGNSGNYWGHNAIIRRAAFESVAMRLPTLPGSAPMGGAILSHDFVEAAFLRRAGWDVALDPDLRGSAEEAPQTLAEFHKRDRRWCQGNLQHMRVIPMPGLHPISRLHMASGIGGYLAAPAWLALLALTGAGAVSVQSAWPIVLVALLLVLPKGLGLIRMLRRPTRARVRTGLRAAWVELALSALVAPLVMVRQSLAVGAVALGRDCGWKSARPRRFEAPTGVIEASFGLALVALSAVYNPAGLGWVLPVAGPLIAAPALIPWLDRRVSPC